jgi:hypothetical protein
MLHLAALFQTRRRAASVQSGEQPNPYEILCKAQRVIVIFGDEE